MNHGDTFSLKGLSFRFELIDDTDAGAPWENEDGHGPVRAVNSSREKRAGERVLCSDRSAAWLYDFAAAVKIAKRDGWSIDSGRRAALAVGLGREPTPGEVRAAAVEADFLHLARYLARDWYYVGVVVTLLDIDGGVTPVSESLWCIESDATEYHGEVAHELAGEIARRIGRRKFLQPQPVARVRVRS